MLICFCFRCMLAGHRARHLQGQYELERALDARVM